MGLFSRSKTVAKTDEKVVVAVPTRAASPADYNLSAVIIRPRITEKAVAQGDARVYTFEVRRDATKYTVAAAIKALYSVTPVKVNIVNKAPARRTRGMQNKVVKVAGMKKAYVYLKKGDSITLV